MNLKIEWNKIVVNTLSVLVGTIIIGAATIVWNGATSVDTKVQDTRSDLQKLIETLSDKLAVYEVQMAFVSNQLSVVITNQSGLLKWAEADQAIEEARANPPVPYIGIQSPLMLEPPRPAPPKTTAYPTESKANIDIRQKARSRDIQQQIQLKK